MERTPITPELLREVAEAFESPGLFVGAAPYGSGHINDTLAAYYQTPDGHSRRTILQRINTHVFRDPEALMENITGVTGFLRQAILKAGGDPLRETLNLVPTHRGGTMYTDSLGGRWRMYLFIEDATTYQAVERPQDFCNSARAFGRFQKLLDGYPAHTLHETIPRFHDTPDRVRQFRAALEADALGRAGEVGPEIQFVLQRQKETSALTDLLAQGKLPLRVTHNDTKLNNVMIDDATGRGLCVIDLDTVMPGLSLYDFGDSIRFGATTAAEDEPDLSKVHFDLELFALYTKGYLETAGDSLTPGEIDLLPLGAWMMTLECGIRFLTDHLAGDTYFKIHRPGHNLDRCRTQFRLVKEMEGKWESMAAALDRCRS